MKHLLLVAAALGATLAATNVNASAAVEGGTVCGRVNAPAEEILSYSREAVPANIIIARSADTTVRTTVAVDGSFCFNDLAPSIYTLTVFNDDPTFNAVSVAPVAGGTDYLELDPTQNL